MTAKRKPNSGIVAARDSLRRNVLPPKRGKPRIKPLWIDWDLARVTVVWSGGVRKLFINLKQVKRESAEHHRIIKKLLIMLHEQANVAMDAVTVAAENLAAAKRLADQSPDAVAARKRQAADGRNATVAGIGLLQREAERLQKLQPGKPIKELRSELLKFPGANVRMVRAVKIARRHKNLPRP